MKSNRSAAARTLTLPMVSSSNVHYEPLFRYGGTVRRAVLRIRDAGSVAGMYETHLVDSDGDTLCGTSGTIDTKEPALEKTCAACRVEASRQRAVLA